MLVGSSLLYLSLLHLFFKPSTCRITTTLVFCRNTQKVLHQRGVPAVDRDLWKVECFVAQWWKSDLVFSANKTEDLTPPLFPSCEKRYRWRGTTCDCSCDETGCTWDVTDSLQKQNILFFWREPSSFNVCSRISQWSLCWESAVCYMRVV